MDEMLDEAFPGGAVGGQRFSQPFVFFGFQITEGEIFHLPLQLAHAQPVCQRGQQIQGFQCDVAAQDRVGVVFEQSQSLQSIGQLDEHGPNIVDHGQQHAAQQLGLVRLLGFRLMVLIESVQPVDLLHQFGGFGAETALDQLGIDAVANVGVAEQGDLNGRRIHT
jgi:hypothetical protein